MGNSAEKASAVDLIMAILVGGPTSLPEESRTQKVSALAQKIKVPYYGGYEHFERLSPPPMPQMPEMHALPEEVVFHWTMRTELAE